MESWLSRDRVPGFDAQRCSLRGKLPNLSVPLCPICKTGLATALPHGADARFKPVGTRNVRRALRQEFSRQPQCRSLFVVCEGVRPSPLSGAQLPPSHLQDSGLNDFRRQTMSSKLKSSREINIDGVAYTVTCKCNLMCVVCMTQCPTVS